MQSKAMQATHNKAMQSNVKSKAKSQTSQIKSQ